MLRTATLFVLIAFSDIVNAQQLKQRVWVDTDISSGKLTGDMDDALALLLLLHDSSIQVEGISLVHGVNYAEKTTRKLLNWYAEGRKIPVYRGADSQKQLGERTEAAKAIEAALERGPLYILALGPATNVVTALSMRPDLWKNVKAISFCAGRRPDMTFTPKEGTVHFSDYNFEHDTTAARMLLQMDVPLILAGYDCADSLFLTKSDYQHLKQSSNDGDRWMYRKLKRWEWAWRSFFGVKHGFIPFDVSTVAALLYPDEVETEHLSAGLGIMESDSRTIIKGATKPCLLVENNDAATTVDYCHHSRNMLKQRLLRVLGKK